MLDASLKGMALGTFPKEYPLTLHLTHGTGKLTVQLSHPQGAHPTNPVITFRNRPILWMMICTDKAHKLVLILMLMIHAAATKKNKG